MLRQGDPITYVAATTPIMILHDGADRLVSYEQIEILFEALKDACVDATYYKLDELGYSFSFEGQNRSTTS